MNQRPDLESRLREALRAQADRLPPAAGPSLAERILADTLGPRRSGSRWLWPVLAAAAVVLVAAGVLVGPTVFRDRTPVTSGDGTAVGSPSLSQAPSPTSSTVPSTTQAPPSSSATPSQTAPPSGLGLTGVALSDLTFVGASDGWAIGTADCLSGSGGQCPAMIRTTDGGASWHSMPTPPSGVTGLRFATPTVGYAYDSSALYLTTDGGASWARQPGGGAEALETLDGNVVRLVSAGDGCPGPCDVRVEYADVGSSSWTTVSLPGLGPTDFVASLALSRSGSDVYVLRKRNPAGGAGTASSTLYSSSDDGAHWTDRGEPCQQPIDKQEIDTAAVAAAPGSVTLLCVPRDQSPRFVSVSTDGGATFSPRAGTVPPGNGNLLAGDPRTVLIMTGGPYRSTDGGASWTPVAGINSEVYFVGFESPTLGRMLTDERRTLWTTRDGGATWSPYRLP